MGFHDVELDSDFIGYGSIVGPGHRTFVPDTQSAIESNRKRRRNQSQRKFSLVNDIDEDQLRELFDFIICRHGSAHSFLVRDPADFTTASDHVAASAFDDVVIGTGDGAKTEFTIKKIYGSDAFVTDRILRKPVLGQVQGGFGGVEKTINVDFTVDNHLGRVSYDTPPASGDVTVGCEFRVQVRFGKQVDDLLGLSYDGFRSASYTLDLIEDMVPVVAGERYVPTTDLINYGGGTNYLSSTRDPLVSPFFLSFDDGMFIEMSPNAADSIVRLPDIDTQLAGFGPSSLFEAKAVVPGGPYFTIYNSGTFDIDMEAYASGWASLTPVAVIAPGKLMETFIDAEGVWRGR